MVRVRTHSRPGARVRTVRRLKGGSSRCLKGALLARVLQQIIGSRRASSRWAESGLGLGLGFGLGLRLGLANSRWADLAQVLLDQEVDGLRGVERLAVFALGPLVLEDRHQHERACP